MRSPGSAGTARVGDEGLGCRPNPDDGQAHHSSLTVLRAEAAYLPRENSSFIGSRTHDSDVQGHATHVEEHAPYGDTTIETTDAFFSVKAILGLWPPLHEFPRWYWSRLTGYDRSKYMFGFFPSWDLLVAFVFACVSMVVLALIEFYVFHAHESHLSIFLPSFGASATILFSVPGAPVAQPRALFFSHVSAAIIGVCFANIFQFLNDETFGFKCVAALVVGLHLVLVCLTNTFHPPASATCVSAALAPLNAYYHDQGFLFVVFPVLLGCIILFLCAWILNNMLESRSPYPKYWW
ncbi:HPP family protein [Trypanosoma conorhini]|uniref:HPP family protein n=1 Tax=Trypanosoma conorhini TaxID=83891 RepID=A0A3R7PNN6_9TRYP|nr:HPP family protein [Trypanosoma conorhini]RNF22793.1 HPP family protein [Trypanosoma conorhini]